MPKNPISGFLYDYEKLVGRIVDGELRPIGGGKLLGVVKDGWLYDPQTGERICGLSGLDDWRQPLPAALKEKLK